jgi:hypothetical protein
MDLERIMCLGKYGKNLVVSVLLSGAILGSCNKVDVTTPDDITIDTKHVGMIEGRVTKPIISNNQLSFQGYSGASVQVTGTDLKSTSLSDGVYSIDNVPAGSYNVKATPVDFNYKSSTVSVTVVKQVTNRAPDNQLTPASNNQILYGRVYLADKSSAAGGKLVNLCRVAYSGGTPIPGAIDASTTTSSDGSYAFYHNYNDFMVTGEGKKLRQMSNGLEIMGLTGTGFEVARKDLYIP